MVSEPVKKRAIAFFDGQNLYHSVKESFGYSFPNYDVAALAALVCTKRGWQLAQTRFYTGVPDPVDNPHWHHFWTEKLRAMTWKGIYVYKRSLRYRTTRIKLPDGTEHSFLAGEEKGIDIRIALDIIRLAHAEAYDVALVFSQDQDLSEVSDELDYIAKERGRWLKMASAFPSSPTSRNRRGINKTDWIRIDKPTYDACLDPRDYRPKSPPSGPTNP